MMKNIKVLMLIALQSCLLASASFASNTTDANSSTLADGYYMSKKSSENNVEPCYPSRTSCFKTACDLLGTFECDEVSEQERVHRACQAVWGGECITNATTFLGKFEYDDVEEMVQLVQSCRGVYDVECVRYSCTKLGRFGCDDLEEITRVNATCASRYPFYN